MHLFTTDSLGLTLGHLLGKLRIFDKKNKKDNNKRKERKKKKRKERK
jgi:hypothetical protein